MTMTHKEALNKATVTFWSAPSTIAKYKDMEAAIRAYVEARGLVMVPREATEEMYEAARYSEGFEYYHDMLAAAPDPFTEE